MTKERIAHQATYLRIIDGGKSDLPSLQTDELQVNSDFADKVMERLDRGPRLVQTQETVTIIEFCGPKRLSKLIQVKPEERKETKWNLRNFFRKK